MTAIFVVMGSTGEYSDRDEWPVAAFREEARATQLVEKATRRASELEQYRDKDDDPWRYQDASVRPGNEYDPSMKMDYTGTRYFVYTVPLEDA